ncbi:MAG: hypothetical protein CVU02_01970 [Bacteroidetes bacterium HGW-Bacteroidetes-19]|nr:MAG: hypothetical protein CVU04_05325 [Bacteroidetes bacterium HGW-Bacteroidetes-20]PKP28127.1 MAG: hypothetical protein CVU02_01970 [Bacteroidetes bacterium HGW-Bacteroidetes-19]
MEDQSFSIFEVAMLMSFAISWPVSIIKTLRTKFVLGKSVTFMFIILIGYLFGIIHKLLYSNDVVIYCYFLNFFLIAFDISLYFFYAPKNKKSLEK